MDAIDTSNPSRSVILALLLTATLFVAADKAEITQGRLVGAGFVTFILLVGSDFEPTSEIAVAFAFLILLTSLMTVGPAAFDRIRAMLPASSTGGGSGGRRGSGQQLPS